jgi:outer membrane biosynthesis protein TonB
VAVRVLIDENGKIAEAKAIYGPKLLRKAAEDAAREARFSPTQLSGQPVQVTGVINYTFVVPQ